MNDLPWIALVARRHAGSTLEERVKRLRWKRKKAKVVLGEPCGMTLDMGSGAQAVSNETTTEENNNDAINEID